MANTKETKKTEKKNNVHEVIVKIEGVEWTEALDKAFKSKQKDAKVDGFRKVKYLEIFMKNITVKNHYSFLLLKKYYKVLMLKQWKNQI